MSSGSTKELLKLISSCVTRATVPLPDDLLHLIQTFLDKHESIEDSESQRIHEELLAIYHKYIHHRPNRYSFFLAVLRNLRPVLAGRRLLEWWDLLYMPICDSLAKEKGLANEAQSVLLDILVYEEDDSEAARISEELFKRLLKLWLDTCNAPVTENPAAMSATKLLKGQLQYVLISFGRKRTKEFLDAINKLFVQRNHRLQVLPLLCKFIQTQPPRLYDLLQTDLLSSLLRCLTIDTSTTVVSLALSALVMFLPHIPFSMSAKGHLPSLFNIYSRLLFWDRQCNSTPHDNPSDSELDKKSDSHSDALAGDASWEKLSYSFETDDSKVPELLQYFTFLYGLYPINFMDYVRKPKRYLRHANYPGAEEVDIEPHEIRQRSEPFRQLHLLHPNFFNMTIESELADANRFIKMDAPDIITNCMALCTPMYAFVESPAVLPEDEVSVPLNELDDGLSNYPLLDRLEDGARDQDPCIQQWQAGGHVAVQGDRNTPELTPKSSFATRSSTNSDFLSLMPQKDNLKLGANMKVPGARTSLQEMLISQKNLRGSVYQMFPNGSNHSSVTTSILNPENNTDCHRLSLEPQAVSLKSPPLQPSGQDYVASLQREITLLKNDLNFERYLKQQHLSHLGFIRRKHVKDAVVEAETQHLINSNRSLKNKLEEARKTNIQIKKEADKSRTHLKKYETDLTSKLRLLRREQKSWKTEEEILRRDLELSRANCKKLRQMVVDGEAKELLSKQQSMKHLVEENERLQSELKSHTIMVRQFEISENEKDLAKKNETFAWTQVDLLNMKLEARDAEVEEAKKYYSAQIDNLQLKLEEITLDPRRKQLKGFQQMVDNALASSRLKLFELQTEKTKLLKRYGKLERAYMKLQTQNLEHDMQSRNHAKIDESFGQSPKDYSVPPLRRTHAMSDLDIDSSFQKNSPPCPLTLSSSYPDQTHHEQSLGQSPTRPSTSNTRTFSDRYDVSTRPGYKPRTISEAPSSADTDLSESLRNQGEHKLYSRGAIQNIVKSRKEKKSVDADIGEASGGGDRKDKKKKSGGGLKGIRGFVS